MSIELWDALPTELPRPRHVVRPKNNEEVTKTFLNCSGVILRASTNWPLGTLMAPGIFPSVTSSSGSLTSMMTMRPLLRYNSKNWKDIRGLNGVSVGSITGREQVKDVDKYVLLKASSHADIVKNLR